MPVFTSSCQGGRVKVYPEKCEAVFG